MQLIVPMMILQAKATSRREISREDTEEEDRAKVCYIGIRRMYDDIAYSKDDIRKPVYTYWNTQDV